MVVEGLMVHCEIWCRSMEVSPYTTDMVTLLELLPIPFQILGPVLSLLRLMQNGTFMVVYLLHLIVGDVL